MFDQKDLEAIEDVLFALNKAKYSEVDGNDIIRIYKSFVGLNKLASKIKQELEAPKKQPAPVPSQEEPKKPAKPSTRKK